MLQTESGPFLLQGGVELNRRHAGERRLLLSGTEKGGLIFGVIGGVIIIAGCIIAVRNPRAYMLDSAGLLRMRFVDTREIGRECRGEPSVPLTDDSHARLDASLFPYSMMRVRSQL